MEYGKYRISVALNIFGSRRILNVLPLLAALEKKVAGRFCGIAYGLAHAKFDEVTVFVDRIPVFIGFRVIQRDGEIADCANWRLKRDN